MESQIKEKAVNIMENANWNLCDHCLGRMFSKTVEGQNNKQRGEKVRAILNKENTALNTGSCHICGDIFKTIPDKIEKIINRLHDKNIEFSTFLLGCRISPEILKKEESTYEKMNLNVESIKKEINRETGKELELKLQKEANFEYPNIVIMVDFVKDNIEIQINPIFIEGRYRKLIRGIPQTKWPCGRCKGRGCENCNYTGQQYPESVESLVSYSAVELAGGSSSKFHGAGREDIDVKMLGTGRPFVLEIKEPHVRNINLELLENRINEFAEGKVEVRDLKFTGRGRKGEIKCSSTDTYKVYRALIELQNDIEEEKLELLKSLQVIKQRTPVRVSHRRADKIRKREVRRIDTKWINSKKFEMIIECEGGLYIKELISSDEGRSKPSVSEILETPALCTQLDVIEVHI
ncbi:MAG: tRNA pseudouridine(54/55) synthase Pus10 [Methanobacterium sp.]